MAEGRVVWPRWEYWTRLELADEWQSLYRDDRLGLQKEVYVPHKDGLPDPDRPVRVAYFLDGSAVEYATEEAVVRAWARKNVAPVGATDGMGQGEEDGGLEPRTTSGEAEK